MEEKPLLGAVLSGSMILDEHEKVELTFNNDEKKLLRELAKRVKELASRPIEDKKRKLWTLHNSLQDTRPIILCDPENGWNEIITEEKMECTTPLARQWEFRLRREIFWGEEMGDDKVITPYFDLPYVYHMNNWGLEDTIITTEEEGGSYNWEPSLKTFADMDKMEYPRYNVKHELTNKVLELAEDLFGDILHVRLKGMWWFSLSNTLAKLRGLEQLMLDMYDNPEKLHKLIGFLTKGILASLDYFEDNELLHLNNDDTYVGSGGLGYTDELPGDNFTGKVRNCDLWGFSESQETVGISPEMFEEFIYPYQEKILKRFGLNCYGCCEPLDQRWEIVKDLPRLRRVSVSPWADKEVMAEYLGDDYIYSLKPDPVQLADSTIDEEKIRKTVRRQLEITKKHGCHLELIMKDNHTIGNNPQNVTRWCEIVREEIAEVY